MTSPDTLVGTAWLAARLDDPAIRIVDATYFLPDAGRDARAEYAGGHIPGSVFFDIDDIADPSIPLPHMLPSPERFSEKVGALGIGSGHMVVCYDAHGLFSAARAWWMFRVFGHDLVAVLDGGLPRWSADGHPLDDRMVAPVPEQFEPRFRPELVRSADDLIANLASRGERVVDVRSAGRFEGTAPEPRPEARSGHIPGSVNLPYSELIDPDTHLMLSIAELEARFAATGLGGGDPIVASCGSGVTACILALAKHRAGHRDVAVYDGSWSEWGCREDLAIEAGPGPTG